MGCLMNRARWKRLALAATTVFLSPLNRMSQKVPTLETRLMAFPLPVHVNNLREAIIGGTQFL